MDDCFICKRIADIKDHNNPQFVKELNTSYIVLGDYQFYKGYTLVLSKTHVSELHQLPKQIRSEYLNEMAITAEAVYKAFKPKKLNYELLGNTDKHLHWHIIPRYEDDQNPTAPVWVIDKNIRYAEKAKPSKDDLRLLIDQLTHELNLLINP